MSRGNKATGAMAIAICDRCGFKYHYLELQPDGNSPGLRVCRTCWDRKDPWRLLRKKPDALALHFPRTEAPLLDPFGEIITEDSP